MISMVAAAWRVVLKRTLSDWLILAAAFLTILLATTLLSAGPIYAGAVTLSGVHRTLHDAPVRDANVEISARTKGDTYRALDDAVATAGQNAFAPTGGPIFRSGRSESFALPNQEPDDVHDLAVFAFVEQLEQHVALTAGAWPAAGAGSADSPVEAVLSEPAAALMGLKLGDTLSVQSRREGSLIVDVRVVGFYQLTDPTDPFWWEDPLIIEGVQQGESFTTYGPFVVTPEAFLGRLSTASSEVNWRVFPTIDNLTVAEVPTLRRNVEGLEGALNFRRSANDRFSVDTDLDGILRRAERSLLVTRSGVLILTVQLAILAGYALMLTAGLLIEQRRVETALLRSRGGDSGQVATMALMEGIVLALPAALLGPWIAAGALRVLNVYGPLAEIDLSLVPRVGQSAYALAFVSAFGCVAALTVPALRAARSYAEARATRGRQAAQSLAQRAGIDLVLLAVAALAYWQLRRYGAPITETVQDELDLDPFLIAAPAIGLLAGAVIALRIVPLLSRLMERVASGRRRVVPALGGWQLARRPSRYARSALLLMLALAIGLFAVSYTRTWTRSQQDQADYQTGADLRVRPDRRFGSAIPLLNVARAYEQIDGVDALMAVADDTIQVSRSAGSGRVLALDATNAGQIVRFRTDLADEPLDDLLRPLAEARPALARLELPGEPQRLALDVQMTLDPLPASLELPPDWPIDISPSLSLVVQDANGMLYRVNGGVFEPDSGVQRIVVPLAHTMEDGRMALPQYPLSIVSVDVRVIPPPSYQASRDEAAVSVARTGVFELVALQASSAPEGDAWSAVSVTQGAPGWTFEAGQLVAAFEAPEVRAGAAGETPALRMTFSTGSIDGDNRFPITLSALPGASTLPETIPAIVSTRFLDVTETRVGEDLPVDLGRQRRTLHIVGVVDAFPTIDPDDTSIIVIDLPTYTMLAFVSDRQVVDAEEMWIATTPGATTGAAETLRDAPFSAARVLDRVARGRTLRTDPVALGIIGALSLGFGAAALFAAIGFAVSAAVSSRERLTEFALLRALGLSTGQLSGWLSLENGVIVALSVVGGTGLGLLLAWLVLPLVSLTQEAAKVVPGVVVHVPWWTIAWLELGMLAVLVVVVAVLAWALRRVGLGTVLRLGEER